MAVHISPWISGDVLHTKKSEQNQRETKTTGEIFPTKTSGKGVWPCIRKDEWPRDCGINVPNHPNKNLRSGDETSDKDGSEIEEKKNRCHSNQVISTSPKYGRGKGKTIKDKASDKAE